MQHLRPNTTLQGGKYRIERVLGQGGFGNTYVGYNTESEEVVAIKEFFMKGVTERDETTCSVSVSNADNVRQFEEQREKFKKEARRLRKLRNEHLVKVHDLFDENGTSYYVMDYIDGENLAERLKRTGKPMSEKKLREILPQILDALKTVHQNGFCHLDLKPSNIMLEKSGLIKLIDFGASKQLGINGTLTTNDPTALAQTPGFAPREQMEQNLDKIGSWTDIYALGATLYNLLTNKRPPLPTDIDDDIAEDKHNAQPFPSTTSDSMKQLVLWMMNTNRTKRPQSISDISVPSRKKNKKVKSEETTLVDSPDSKSGEETVIMPKEKRTVYMAESAESEGSSLWKYVVAGLIAIVIIILGYNFYDNSQTGLPPTEPLLGDTITSAQDSLQEGTNEIPEFSIKNYSRNHQKGNSECYLSVDFPVSGNKIIVRNIIEWINESLGGNYQGDFSDYQGIVDFYTADIEENTKESTKIKQVYKTDKFITYEKEIYFYNEGGAHGIGNVSGVTFRKDDGRRFGWDMLLSGTNLQSEIKSGLKKYFEVSSDEELAENLFLSDEYSINNLPKPSLDPWLNSKGLVFMYGSYEIASYAAGYPTFTIPYGRLKNILTPTALDLIE